MLAWPYWANIRAKPRETAPRGAGIDCLAMSNMLLSRSTCYSHEVHKIKLDESTRKELQWDLSDNNDHTN